ncbi:MAG: stage II sporulation protein M [Pseudomonadota bacterium]|jgi:uncharacterized membrane protein SpoIIM required for sporulation
MERFIREEQQYWTELEKMLNMLEDDPGRKLSLDETRRFYYLYQRTAADLSKIASLPSERDTRGYLDGLASRAFGEIHQGSRPARGLDIRKWITVTFPGTFRKHLRAFSLALAVTVLGGIFGAGAVALDPASKEILMPFAHLQGDPSKRVAEEESGDAPRRDIQGITFSSYLMTHNTRVAIYCMALGFTFGIGTITLLFYNGAILGAVALDYMRAGETAFLLGWLMPHGVIEIPAILIGGQIGLIIAGVLMGRKDGRSMGQRFREATPDAVILIFGVALLLVWAGVVEAFVSQHHEPVLPYPVKIMFGVLELGALTFYLSRSGRKSGSSDEDPG